MAKVKKMIMKKNLFVAAAMMVAMTACVKEADVNVNVEENLPQTEEKVWVEFTAGVETKAVLNGTVVEWEANDLISINGVKFAIPNQDAISGDKKTAKFKAAVDPEFLEAESFTAVYPASAVVDGNVVVPAEQDGTAKVVAVATVSEVGANLQFRHLTSFFKFQVPAAVSEVTISATENLVGTVNNVVYNETISYNVVSGNNTITLTGSFETGKTYYAAVLPGTKKNLTVRFDGYLSKAWTSDVTIEYGMIANMKTLPAPVKSDWGIAGTMTNWTANEDIVMYKEGDYSVAKNVTIASTDEFKFRKGGDWNKGGEIAGGITAPNTKRDGGWVNITVSEAGIYDVYTNGTNYYIMTPGQLPSAATAPGPIEITVTFDGDTNRDYIHIWSDGGEIANNKACNSKNPFTWKVTVPAGDQQKRDYQFILKKDSGWGSYQTTDSDKLCLRNPMPLKIVDNKVTHK